MQRPRMWGKEAQEELNSRTGGRKRIFRPVTANYHGTYLPSTMCGMCDE
jgi:hypothetical protein